MAVIETKYSIGETVYYAATRIERKQRTCPDCNDTRRWEATSPAGQTYAMPCPRCTTSYRSMGDLSLVYNSAEPSVEKLTIGSVKTDSHRGAWGEDEPVSYMCTETGVGSGSVYREGRLHKTREDALAAAKLMAAKQNDETPWIKKQFDKAFEISDYQLESAALKDAKDFRSRAGSMLYNLTDLFDTIKEAEDKDAILEAIDEYQKWYWQSDLEKIAAQGMEAPQGVETTGSTEGDSPVGTMRPEGDI